MSSCCHPFCPCGIVEAIPIPADQPIMQIKDLDEVAIPTVEIKVKNYATSFIILNHFCLEDVMQFLKTLTCIFTDDRQFLLTERGD